MSLSEIRSTTHANMDDVQVTSCELDTHADTCCFGKNCYIMSSDLNHTAEVTPFTEGLGKISHVPIVTVAVAYDCPRTYQTYILIFHKALFIKQLNHHLLCPNQMRLAGTIVNDCPAQFLAAANRDPYTHSVVKDNVVIPLKMKGVLSYFNVRMPTDDEIFDTNNYVHIEMTSVSEWDPYDHRYEEDEDFIRTIDTDYVTTPSDRQLSVVGVCLSGISSVL